MCKSYSSRPCIWRGSSEAYAHTDCGNRKFYRLLWFSLERVMYIFDGRRDMRTVLLCDDWNIVEHVERRPKEDRQYNWFSTPVAFPTNLNAANDVRKWFGNEIDKFIYKSQSREVRKSFSFILFRSSYTPVPTPMKCALHSIRPADGNCYFENFLTSKRKSTNPFPLFIYFQRSSVFL